MARVAYCGLRIGGPGLVARGGAVVAVWHGYSQLGDSTANAATPAKSRHGKPIGLYGPGRLSRVTFAVSRWYSPTVGFRETPGAG